MRLDAMFLHVVALRLGAGQADCPPRLHPACRAPADTPKRSAAARRAMPPSTSATDRERTSLKTRETEPVSPKGRSEGKGLRSCRNLLPMNPGPYKVLFMFGMNDGR